MAGRQLKLVLGAVALVATVVVAFLLLGSRPSTKDKAPVQSTPPAQQPVNTPIVIIPQTITIPDSPLRQSVIAAGDYLVRQQISNGELSYQVDFISGAREYSPSYIRLVAGTGALYTVCRISEDSKYCDAGDLALDKYLELLVSDPKRFAGICLYTTGSCQLGGSALTVDAIYKRWQATGNFTLGDRDLMNIAKNLGYFILSMRKPEGGFYHSYDPHYGGTVDADYFVVYFPGESLLALMELYEMTGNEFWLAQAREINNYMITQPVTEDHWHSYALNMFARLDTISQDDKNYGRAIADTIIDGQVRSLNPANSSISTATKIESLAALAQTFYYSAEEYKWLDPEIRTFITFVRARQLPDNNCNWDITAEMQDMFAGGIFSSCEESSIRVDGLQHYINGVTTYLEFQELIHK